ncbi:RNA polymerase sigma factor domain protein [Mycobacterium kansasii 732]|nr:RNA polymerase sigma factor domain protein [Mycobacterium kansasii 732]
MGGSRPPTGPCEPGRRVRADLLRRAGRRSEALVWYRKALDANGSDPGRAFLRRRIAECGR